MPSKPTAGEKLAAAFRFHCECLGAVMQAEARKAIKAAIAADRKARTKPATARRKGKK